MSEQAHSPPSAPTSPLPKRTKQMDPLAGDSKEEQQPQQPAATDGNDMPSNDFVSGENMQAAPLNDILTTDGIGAPNMQMPPMNFSDPLGGAGGPTLPSLNASMLQDPLLGPGAAFSMPPMSAPLSAGGAAVPPLQIKKLSDKARTPTRGSVFAAGYDLYSAEGGVVPAYGKLMVGTGIAVAVPPGTYGRVAPRSGLASKHSIATGAGVIDYDYRGEVKLLLFNHSDTEFKVEEGDRVAQLVLERIVTPSVIEVEELDGTERGAGGFGSTGGFGGILNGGQM